MGNKRIAHYERSGAACRELEALASAYIDNELPRALKQKLRTHLRDCKQCASLISELQQITAVAKELELPVPEKARQRVRAAIKAEMYTSKSLRRRLEVLE
jgi:anti-sigma factor RsiW